MVNEFEKRLEAADKPGQAESKPQKSYSRAYEQFKAEQTTQLSTTYERMANAAGKILKTKVKPEERVKLQKYITMTHLNIEPESVNALAILSLIPFLIATVVVFIATNSLFFTFLLLGSGIFTLYSLANMPKTIYDSWRSRAADQIMLAVLYIVIHMKRDANLERAILFVANQMSPPLSLDFMKVLWNFETKKFSTVQAALDDYLETWKDTEPAFVDAMHLIESSLVEPNTEKARKTLEKANEVITQGINDNMIHFAHNLKNPVQMIHMLGIVLPLMLLVMLPMVGAFLADSISSVQLITMYNVVLPIFVFVQAKKILSIRPGGAGVQNKRLLAKFPNSATRPMLAAIAILLVITAPAIFLIYLIGSSGDWSMLRFENSVFYISIGIIFAMGLALYVYYHFKNKKIMILQNKIQKIEDQFSSAIFQLGNRIGENVPAEAAFGRVAENTKGSEISKFFEVVDSNIRQRGMTLESAIFDKRYGANNLYPSDLIASIMRLLLEAVKKSPAVAAESMTTLSKYLQNMHAIKEKMTDLLSDTLSSMKMQASFLAPMVSALVISLSVLITRVLIDLSTKLNDLQSSGGSADDMGFGGGIASIFKIESAIPPYLLQLMVGIYIIQVVFLLSFTLSGIIDGPSKTRFEWAFSKNILKSTLLYCTLAFIGTIIFSSMAFIVTSPAL
jgi:hypothetical protein